MGKRKAKTKRPPKVRMAHPKDRPFQLRYSCPTEKREIRISTGTHDENEAERQKAELEARLLLGIDTPKKHKQAAGPQMPWEEFRDRYSDIQLTTLRPKSAIDAESRLDVATRILKPRTLADMANSEALHTLQARLLAGAESRYDRPRSPHTVKSAMAAVLAAINWANFMEWLPAVPRIQKVKVSRLVQMKGRPLAGEEFERMLDATEKLTGPEAAPSWRYVLRGLWSSGLRLAELMNLSWDDPSMIRPVWPRCGDPVLEIPHELQKNDTEESIPLLPWFEAVLLQTDEVDRTRWVFNPASLQTRIGRRPRLDRPTSEWVGRVVSKIGKKAGVVVAPANPKRGTQAKFASSHDLRRSCAQRLDDAGVREEDIMRVTRHRQRETLRRHYAPGSVQKSAQRIREYLGTVPDPIVVSPARPTGFEPVTLGSEDRCAIQLRHGR